jgi:hypothetical protein
MADSEDGDVSEEDYNSDDDYIRDLTRELFQRYPRKN